MSIKGASGYILAMAFFMLTGISWAQPVATAIKVPSPPVIDGKIEDSCWQNCPSTNDFKEFDPEHGSEPRFQTAVHFAYDDAALYILAVMSDDRPDSVLRQLGERDQDNLNADAITFAFDTYHKQSDAFFFRVSASGTQADWRESDGLYDAVWKSVVNVTQEGWLTEIRIPYSAIRFPSVGEQVWGLQITRNLRREREISQWALEDLETSNEMLSWGKLTGIKGIDPPLRLSLTPYASFAWEHDPGSGDEQEQDATAFNGGLDLKLGISEAYTLDMTLLPDFSQVRSDREIKNLSAFETTYDENRPFFREGTELFNKGNLFYSRRIGGTPSGYNRVNEQISENETVIENPDQARLINATKISGRNSRGLALGLFNAITDKTYATIRNIEGEERKIQTEPFSNYNILVADKQFSGGSSVYLINTNVSRNGNARDANVTGGGVELTDRENMFELRIDGSISNIWVHPDSSNQPVTGSKLDIEFEKASGNFQFELGYYFLDDDYNINDMGVIHRINRESFGAVVIHEVFEPFGIFRNMENQVGGMQTLNQSTRKNENTYLFYGGNTTLRNYLTLWWGLNYSPFDRYDYYEPRVAGRYYVRPGYLNGHIGFSTDYRKPLALDGNFYLAKEFGTYREKDFSLTPIFRITDHLAGEYEFQFNEIEGAPGYVESDGEGNIVFGERKLTTYTNTLNTKYLFSPRLAINFWLRHYWRTGQYGQFFDLEQDGSLSERSYDENPDFSFNSFNIDLAVNWEFAPGSLLTFVWKNAIITEKEEWEKAFTENLRSTLREPHWNTLSLKFIYYLDYQNIKSIFANKPEG